MGAQFVGKNGTDPLVIHPLRGGDGICPMAVTLHHTGQPGYNLIEPGIDDVIAMGTIAGSGGPFDMARELIDDWVEKSDTD